MSHIPSASTTPTAPMGATVENTVVSLPRSLSWGAVIGGALAALGVHLLLTLLFIGLGVQTIQPLSDENPGEKLTIATGIAWSVSSLIALWVGGWVAGRSLQSSDRRLGAIHGFVVWALATVTLFLVVSTTAGMAAAGAARLAGRGLAMAGGAAGKAAAGAASTDQGSSLISSFVDEIAPTGNATNSARARREVGMALTRVFSSGQDIHSPENQTLLTRALVDYTGRSEADARRVVGDWTASYTRMQDNVRAAKESAEQTAREAAQRSRKTVTQTAIWTFLAFALGALTGTMGGRSGVVGFRHAVADGAIPAGG